RSKRDWSSDVCSSDLRFLGYEIVTLHNDRKLDQRGHRSINGQIGLKVPTDVVREKYERYLRHGKPIHRGELIHDSLFSIVAQYQIGRASCRGRVYIVA